ncbi:MAG: hypothetical protein IT204_14830 [Fimbriimonadaceae bacterium]|nr:hypothetical protein [Fimbriimonadaceae bacterium]
MATLLALLAAAQAGQVGRPESFISPDGVVLASDLVWPERLADRLRLPQTVLERDIARRVQPGEAAPLRRPGEAQTRAVAAVLTRWKQRGGQGTRWEALTADWSAPDRRQVASWSGLPDLVVARLLLEHCFRDELQTYGLLTPNRRASANQSERAYGSRTANLTLEAATGDFRRASFLTRPAGRPPVRSAAVLRAKALRWLREHRVAAADWPLQDQLRHRRSELGVSLQFLLRPEAAGGAGLPGAASVELTERGQVTHAYCRIAPVEVLSLEPRISAAQAGAAALASIRTPTKELIARGWLAKGRPEATLRRTMLEVYRNDDGQRLVWTCEVESRRFGGMSDYVRVDALNGQLLGTTKPLADTYIPPREPPAATPEPAAPPPAPAPAPPRDRARPVTLALFGGLALLIGWLARRTRA